MKKLSILSMILLVLCMPIFSAYPFGVSSANQSIYAKVEQNGVYIYSSTNTSESNKLFELPFSYFVRLIENAENDCYYCAYKDVYGYVKRSDVVAMQGNPVNPFVEANFRVFLPDGTGLFSTPSYSEQYRETTIPYLTDNLTYYGLIQGQTAVPDKSNVWIYCKYNLDKNNYGYVYSVFCDKLPTIVTNNERFEILTSPLGNSSSKSPKELTSVAMGFIIVGVSLPCLIVLYLLMRPSMLKEKVEPAKSKFRGKKHKDYFDFDENDLN